VQVCEKDGKYKFLPLKKMQNGSYEELECVKKQSNSKFAKK